MVQNVFKKDAVNTESLRPGDSFGMDIDRNNFGDWQARLPEFGIDAQSHEEAIQDLAESYQIEFSPRELTRAYTQQELEAIDAFELKTIPALSKMMTASQSEWDVEELQVSCTPYEFSPSMSSVRQVESTGQLLAPEVLVASYVFQGLVPQTEEKTWRLPDIVGCQQERTLVLDPEVFTTGPVLFAHVLYRGAAGDELQERIVPRFSSAAFQEAVEHFVGSHAGVSAYRSQYSFINELVQENLEQAYPEQEVSIENIRLVENRFQSSMFHFSVEVSDGQSSWNTDVCVVLRASGEVDCTLF